MLEPAAPSNNSPPRVSSHHDALQDYKAIESASYNTCSEPHKQLPDRRGWFRETLVTLGLQGR